MNANDSTLPQGRQPPKRQPTTQQPPEAKFRPVQDSQTESGEGEQQPQRPGPRKPPSSRDALDQISRLISGEPEGDQGDQGDDEQPPQRGKKPKTFDDVAKLLGVDVAALYDLEIPLRPGDGAKGGVAKKLGELKDYFSAQDDHRLDRLDWEERRDREQASIARERAELTELMGAIPPDKLNADIINAARRRIDAVVQSERRKTLERIPAWGDDNTRTVELEGIAEHLADYGFPAVALQGITDHRMLMYMRDNWLRMKRLQDALEKVKPVRTPGTPRAQATGSAPRPVRPQSQSTRVLDQQVDAISKLLRG